MKYKTASGVIVDTDDLTNEELGSILASSKVIRSTMVRIGKEGTPEQKKIGDWWDSFVETLKAAEKKRKHDKAETTIRKEKEGVSPND